MDKVAFLRNLQTATQWPVSLPGSIVSMIFRTNKELLLLKPYPLPVVPFLLGGFFIQQVFHSIINMV
jgi:hypothetical protein